MVYKIGHLSSFANILPANWFKLAYSPIFYPSKIFPRTVYYNVSQTCIEASGAHGFLIFLVSSLNPLWAMLN